LTHYIPLYQVRVLQSIARSVRDFHVLLSTPIEPNRDFAPDWSGLDVTVQDTWTMRRRWRHRSAGFDDPLYVHFPYDTMRRLRELQPDVVMSLELGARSAGAAMYRRRHPESRLVLCTYMSERTEQGRGWMRRLLRRRLLGRADALTYNGPSCRRYLESCGVPAGKLHHFPYAADDRTVYHGPIERCDDETRNHLLCVGQLSERKGVLPLLQQVSRYCQSRPNRRLHLTFAGDGPLRGQIESYPTPPNLSVEILGNVSPDELAARMVRSGVMVAPTLADEWMLVVNEALQAGLPVIGSIHSQAVSTLIRDAVNGWQYDPTEQDALARAIDCYLGETECRIAEIRTESRASVAQRTPEWAAAGAMHALRSVLGQAEPSGKRRSTNPELDAQ
jgi:glycosyltransferase involved in cell wall biosynthesis